MMQLIPLYRFLKDKILYYRDVCEDGIIGFKVIDIMTEEDERDE